MEVIPVPWTSWCAGLPQGLLVPVGWVAQGQEGSRAGSGLEGRSGHQLPPGSYGEHTRPLAQGQGAAPSQAADKWAGATSFCRSPPYCWLSLGPLEGGGVPVTLQQCHSPLAGLKLFPTLLEKTMDNYSLLTPNQDHEQAWVPWFRVHTDTSLLSRPCPAWL